MKITLIAAMDEQENKGQLRGIIKSIQQAIKLRKAKL